MSRRVVVSAEQSRVLTYLQTHGGVLVRFPGGFWTTHGTPKQRVGTQQWPEWSTTIQTVRAMEKKGLLRRTNRFPEEWRDDREIMPQALVADGYCRHCGWMGPTGTHHPRYATPACRQTTL